MSSAHFFRVRGATNIKEIGGFPLNFYEKYLRPLAVNFGIAPQKISTFTQQLQIYF